MQRTSWNPFRQKLRKKDLVIVLALACALVMVLAAASMAATASTQITQKAPAELAMGPMVDYKVLAMSSAAALAPVLAKTSLIPSAAVASKQPASSPAEIPVAIQVQDQDRATVKKTQEALKSMIAKAQEYKGVKNFTYTWKNPAAAKAAGEQAAEMAADRAAADTSVLAASLKSAQDYVKSKGGATHHLMAAAYPLATGSMFSANSA